MAAAPIQEHRTTLQLLASILVDIPKLEVATDRVAERIEVLVEALAPEGIVVAINSIVSVAAYQTEGA